MSEASGTVSPLHPAAETQSDSTHSSARAEAIAARDAVRAELEQVRAERNRLNDRIRALDAELDTLSSVVATFDRRRAREQEAAKPVRRARRNGSQTGGAS